MSHERSKWIFKFVVFRAAHSCLLGVSSFVILGCSLDVAPNNLVDSSKIASEFVETESSISLKIDATENPNAEHSSRVTFSQATWEKGEIISPTGRSNPMSVPQEDLSEKVNQGKLHALDYPISVTGMTIPHETLRRFFAPDPFNPLKTIFSKLTKIAVGFGTLDEMLGWVGLHPYPKNHSQQNEIPRPSWMSKFPDYRMGTSIIKNSQNVEGITFSCAACHSANLFGKKVLGMTNRFPRSNEFFIRGKNAMNLIEPNVIGPLLGMSRADQDILSNLKNNVKYIDGRSPLVLGLDTSLAHVALSLSHRAPDEWSTKDPYWAKHPRNNPLQGQPGDSKPAVWWTLKYKNRWLSDGSVVSGNPITTNILWNELGRGTDLHELEAWMQDNESILSELTTAVFASEAPSFFEFFDSTRFDLEGAKRGQLTFDNHCSRCHGSYEKGWNQGNPDDENLSTHFKASSVALGSPAAPTLNIRLNELLKTTKVRYFPTTPVVDVNTDPWRFRGMKAFAEGLNGLALSKRFGVVIEPQEGYVPPPLIGIWARWPYFHNNAAPNLCAVLTPSEQRPKVYFAGDALSTKTDFDEICNGYPLGNAAPSAWKRNREAFFDTSRQGLSNQGHDEGIFLNNGVEILTDSQKKDLIRFLQTL